MYAQRDFQDKVGDSNLTIAQAGCFTVAFSDLLEKVGVIINPRDLNTFFTTHGVYTYDKTDKANDDLYWNSVTRYCPQLVMAQVGGAGFPASDLAIVEFNYRGSHGEAETHFCVVNKAADRSIIDAYDMKVKTPAEYEHVYGQPIAWATYVFHTPATMPSMITPAAAVSAPIAQTTAAPVSAPSSPRTLYLPASVAVWHVYAVGGPWTLPYATHVLSPKTYNGLTYDILGNPAPNIYIIKTQMYGNVAIYAGPDTVAQFPGVGHGEGEDTGIPGENTVSPNPGIPVSEVVLAPIVFPPVEPTPEPTVSSIVYARFDDPMNVIIQAGGKALNFVSNTIVVEYDRDTEYTAVGKATLPNKDTYFMSEYDFGEADITQHTPITVGIKTIDLKLAPSAPVAVTPPEPEHQVAVPVTITPQVAAVRPPTVPELALPWQRTMRYLTEPTAYLVRPVQDATHISITDYATGEEADVVIGSKPVTIGGWFIFGGLKYWRAQSSISKGTWYGFPVTALIKQTAQNTPYETNDDINQVGRELDMMVSKKKHTAIKVAATADAFLDRFKKKRTM